MMQCYGIAFFKIKVQIIHYAAASLSANEDYEIHKPTNILSLVRFIKYWHII
jgi:hypothetical protein